MSWLSGSTRVPGGRLELSPWDCGSGQVLLKQSVTISHFPLDRQRVSPLTIESMNEWREQQSLARHINSKAMQYSWLYPEHHCPLWDMGSPNVHMLFYFFSLWMVFKLLFIISLLLPPRSSLEVFVRSCKANKYLKHEKNKTTLKGLKINSGTLRPVQRQTSSYLITKLYGIVICIYSIMAAASLIMGISCWKYLHKISHISLGWCSALLVASAQNQVKSMFWLSKWEFWLKTVDEQPKFWIKNIQSVLKQITLMSQIFLVI